MSNTRHAWDADFLHAFDLFDSTRHCKVSFDSCLFVTNFRVAGLELSVAKTNQCSTVGTQALKCVVGIDQ